MSRQIAFKAAGFRISWEETLLVVGTVDLVNALPAQDLVKSKEKNRAIGGKGKVALVKQIQANPLTEGNIIAPQNLSEARNAWANSHAQSPGIRIKSRHLLADPRARPNETHIAFEHIDKFRNFIQRRSAKEMTDPSRALLIVQQLPVSIPLIIHSAEFQNKERPAVASDTDLAEERIASLNDDKQNNDKQQNRTENAQPEQRKDNIKPPLAKAAVIAVWRRQLERSVRT